MRTKNLLKNGMWGIISQIVLTILGFAGRTVFLKYLNTEYLGLQGLFTNILMIMSLAELGVGTAIGYNLYKPVSEGNEDEISAIMRLFKGFYATIAVVVLCIGLLIMPYLSMLTKHSTIDLRYITIFFAMYLFQTVSSYFFSYKFILLNVHQKQYLFTTVELVAKVISIITNIFILVLTKNFILYLTIDITIGILKNFILSNIIERMYPYLRKKQILNTECKRKIIVDTSNIFLGKLAYTVLAATDNIVISTFVSLATVGIYSNYTMIIGAINGFVVSFTNAAQAGIGNMLVSESKEHSYEVIKKITFILFLGVSYCAVSLVCLIDPFIELWLGKSYLLNFATLLLCVMNFYLQLMKGPLWQTLSVSGLFSKDKYIALLSAILNLGLSVTLASIYGVAGVIAGTIISQSVEMALKSKLLFRGFFNKSASEYNLKIIEYTLLTVSECILTYLICQELYVVNAVVSLIVKFIICLIVPNVINFILYRKSSEFKYLINVVECQVLSA